MTTSQRADIGVFGLAVIPAALIQRLRDFFGAHTYRRVDRDGVFHTLWSEHRTERAV